MITDPLLVVQTYLVAPRGRPEIYEVILAPDAARDAPRLVLRTANVAVYQLALQLEGGGGRAVATYHTARTGQVLDALERVA